MRYPGDGRSNMKNDTVAETAILLGAYNRARPGQTAKALRDLWLSFAPNKGIALIKAEQLAAMEAAGTPVPVLKEIGKALAKAARKDIDSWLPLARLLWDEYGREGRIVALIAFGAMELEAPERILPLLREICGQCLSWEDADRLAMDAAEPIVRKFPEKWIGEMEAWVSDGDKWIRRAAITILGRLPMKHPRFAERCLTDAGRILADPDTDVRRAVSFAIRTCARVDPATACAFLKVRLPPEDPEAAWVLCDAIRSMDKRILKEFLPLLPRYEKWLAAASGKEKRGIEGAISVLRACT
jgi:3-methyladenine DNA glycosylase AlkD